MGLTRVTSDGITDGSILNADLHNSAAIAGTKIANSSITGSKLVNDTITAVQLAAGAADVNVVLDGAIVNSKVNASAAIAGTKISPDFGSQNISCSGTISTTGSLRVNQTNGSLFFGTDSGGYGGNAGIGIASTNNFHVTGSSGGDMVIGAKGGQRIVFGTSGTANAVGTSRLIIKSGGTVDIAGNLDVGAGLDVTGNITVTGTVDGVDIAARDSMFGALTSGNATLSNGVQATTQAAGDNSVKVATTAFVSTAISNLVDSSPSALNTLNELAAALGDDANFSTTVTNSIATKMPLAGGTFTGDVVFNGGGGAASIGGNSDLRFYNGSTWTGDSLGKIQLFNNTFYISGGTGGIIFREGGTSRWRIDGDGHFRPEQGDGTLDIGTNSVRVRNGYFDTLYGDGSNLTGVTSTTINSNADNRVITGSGTANTLNGESNLTFNGSTLGIAAGSSDNKIQIDGTSPYIQFREGTTNKASLQWHSDGFFRLNNEEDGSQLRIQDDIKFSLNGSLFYKVWHGGNDGSGSGLDADTVDGIQASSFIRSDTADTASGDITFSGGAGAITLTAGSDIRMTSGTWTGEHAGKIQYHSNKMYIQGGSNGHQLRDNSGGTTFEINPSGTCAGVGLTLGQTVQHNADATFNGGAGAATIATHSDIRFNAGNWTGEASYKIQAHSGHMYLQAPAFIFRDDGGSNRWAINSSGHLIPEANNTYDIGSSGNRVRNIYTNDLNLSNEGGANDVDQTWGSFTIQEGAEDLFLINKRNGKKYKFNLTEVS